MEGNDPRIAPEMGLIAEDFRDQDLYPCSKWEEQHHYQLLLLRLLAQLESLGFSVAVLVVGHYPLVDHARAAATLFNKRPVAEHRPEGRRMLAWACVDYLLVMDRWPDIAGDHAGGWETSHLLDSHPETVDLGVLPPRGEPLIGVGGRMPPQDATAAFGRKTMDMAVEGCLAEVKRRLDPETRKHFYGHGCSMDENLPS